MTDEKTRNDELREQFLEYHRAKPELWRTFCRQAFDRIKKGFKHGSASGIMSAIRWETETADEKGRSTWKINNDFIPFYSRLFMQRYPEHEGFFFIRHQTSKDVAAYELPPLTPEDFPTIPFDESEHIDLGDQADLFTLDDDEEGDE